ncbi:6-pyruvoyl trahydropterin synthase family protein [Bdellovibrio svalbardensis]|uniref:6-carboxy-5,6,7,8-tetrahydropterin synthase n=1 Tax=Bdellovibrio svalbardensis TaxID=2972972 RepID=A0ABT6DNJ1_9BACT|nr:6-carboxytetrahydropterin synthase [Bdellovibrio svalbardensis]MDG0818199.1 6-carboxytetrahydropterin synthase [Bdellovibrio svalbardensis]
MSTTTLHLAKQNFKFSAAHFLIFDETHAERLHGHNYQVKVDILAPTEEDLHSEGYFIDFNVFKKFIKAKLDSWDEIVLLPKDHPDMKFKSNEKSLEVTFRDRFYVFPKNEVILLPVTNTSVENLSRLLAEEFFAEFAQYGVRKVKVLVEETRGQGASSVVAKSKA